MNNPDSFYEIEMKALLSKEQHARLAEELPSKFKKINEETIITTRYRRGSGTEDIRLRISDKTIEVVSKTGDPTFLARKETKIPLHSKETLDYFAKVFEELGFNSNPPWEKHKTEYEVDKNGFTYIICLQHIFDFAYILEVEKISKEDDSAIHGPNLRSIIRDLGLEPIEPKSFSERIEEYIRNKKIDYVNG